MRQTWLLSDKSEIKNNSQYIPVINFEKSENGYFCHQKSETRNPKSEIRNRKPAIRNLKSEIRNLKSEIQNQLQDVHVGSGGGGGWEGRVWYL